MQLMADIHAYISANLRQAAMLNVTVLLQTELNAAVRIRLKFIQTQLLRRREIKPKFHYADFPVTSATNP